MSFLNAVKGGKKLYEKRIANNNVEPNKNVKADNSAKSSNPELSNDSNFKINLSEFQNELKTFKIRLDHLENKGLGLNGGAHDLSTTLNNLNDRVNQLEVFSDGMGEHAIEVIGMIKECKDMIAEIKDHL